MKKRDIDNNLQVHKLEINKDVEYKYNNNILSQFNYSVGDIKNRGVIKNNYFHDIKRSIRTINYNVYYIILYYICMCTVSVHCMSLLYTSICVCTGVNIMYCTCICNFIVQYWK